MEIGDKVRIIIYGSGSGNTRYVKSTIIKIYDKKLYNMYECKTEFGYKICFTDLDLIIKLKNRLVLKGW